MVAFGLALYFSTVMGASKEQRPSPAIIWQRFPKFVLGFIAASIIGTLVRIIFVGTMRVTGLTEGPPMSTWRSPDRSGPPSIGAPSPRNTRPRMPSGLISLMASRPPGLRARLQPMGR